MSKAGTPILDQMPRSYSAVTPGDSTDLTTLAGFGLWVGVGGDVAVMGVDDTAAVTLKNVPSGTMLWGQFKRCMATNTTATNIVAVN
jgi:hypothetical protein